MRINLIFIALAVALVLPSSKTFAAEGRWDATEFGVRPDEKFDNTEVLQKALDTAGNANGGVVTLPAGRFRVNGTLSIPKGVTLEGTWRSAPTIENMNEKATGTILLAYAGRNQPDGPPFIRLAGNNSVVSGLGIIYPEWDQKTVPPVPYPPCIESTNTNNVAVLNCCLLNPYEGIKFVRAARHLVRNVTGYPIKRGLFVDCCYDIGHVENVHYWPFGLTYRADDPYCQWINLNGVAFEFARTDWHYVFNTFCFGYGVGYKFSNYKNGACNGNFLGIGADSCQRAVLVEDAQKPGLLITNGEFVGRWQSEDAVCMEIGDKCNGKVSLTNCSFWGPIQTCIEMKAAKGQFTANACHFVNWDIGQEESPALALLDGKTIIQGCTFEQDGTHVFVDKSVRNVILTGNQAEGGLQVEGDKTHLQTAANEEDPLAKITDAFEYYQFLFGGGNDGRFLRGWYHPESRPGKEGEKPVPFRWSKGTALLRLPVLPQKEYQLELVLSVPGPAVKGEAEQTGLFLGNQRLSEPLKSGNQPLTVTIPPQQGNRVELQLRAISWTPKSHDKKSNDGRELGVQGIRLIMKAKGTTRALFDFNEMK